jgi:hypothetical protein
MRYMGLGWKRNTRSTSGPLLELEDKTSMQVGRWCSVITIMAMEGRTYRPWDMLLETSVLGEGTILIMYPVCSILSITFIPHPTFGLG